VGGSGYRGWCGGDGGDGSLGEEEVGGEGEVRVR